VAETKENRYNYEAICDKQGCDAKGVVQNYKSSIQKETIKCVSCGNELDLTLTKINLMYQDGIEV
jgi:hypothetical protein